MATFKEKRDKTSLDEISFEEIENGFKHVNNLFHLVSYFIYKYNIVC